MSNTDEYLDIIARWRGISETKHCSAHARVPGCKNKRPMWLKEGNR